MGPPPASVSNPGRIGADTPAGVADDAWTAARELNKQNWDGRVAQHLRKGSAYLPEIRALLQGKPNLQPVDIKQFGACVAGKTMLHLQCHIGCDTIGWRHYGARYVVGVDFSQSALDQARKLAHQAGVADNVQFVQCDVYDTKSALRAALPRRTADEAAHAAVDSTLFDCVFTSVGVLCWIHNIKRWAKVVASCIAPGGRFYIRDGHPVLNTLADDDTAGFGSRRKDSRGGRDLLLNYPYFEQPAPTNFSSDSSYTGEADTGIQQEETREWNHGLGEIITALIEAGLTIDWVKEHKDLDWKFVDTMTQVRTGHVAAEVDECVFGGWRLPLHQQESVPLMFSILATKRS